MGQMMSNLIFPQIPEELCRKPSSHTLHREGSHLDVSNPLHHPLPTGFVFSSPGKHFTYRVIGSCCQLFDREELPWPCCRIQWHSKEPSWRRVGRRFVADIAAKRCPSYSVMILNQEYSQDPFVLTLYWVQFPPDVREWWYSRIRGEL